MRINVAHLGERSTMGGWIDFAVFDVKSTTGTNDKLLLLLTMQTRASGLKIDQSAFAYMEGGRSMFYGSQELEQLSLKIPAPTLKISLQNRHG